LTKLGKAEDRNSRLIHIVSAGRLPARRNDHCHISPQTRYWALNQSLAERSTILP